MKRALIDVDDLYPWSVHDDLDYLLRKLLLPLAQLLLPLVLRLVHDLRLDELASELLVDSPNSARR